MSPEPISSDSDHEKEEDEDICETLFPQLINNPTSSTGFGFDYLT
jgi:hypothetical protein